MGITISKTRLRTVGILDVCYNTTPYTAHHRAQRSSKLFSPTLHRCPKPEIPLPSHHHASPPPPCLPPHKAYLHVRQRMNKTSTYIQPIPLSLRKVFYFISFASYPETMAFLLLSLSLLLLYTTNQTNHPLFHSPHFATQLVRSIRVRFGLGLRFVFYCIVLYVSR